jgi:hypothetical protein
MLTGIAILINLSDRQQRIMFFGDGQAVACKNKLLFLISHSPRVGGQSQDGLADIVVEWRDARAKVSASSRHLGHQRPPEEFSSPGRA